MPIGEQKPQINVMVLGAGVIGLTIAHVLTADANEGRFKVSVIARDLPEDINSQAFASPWAGANWSPMFHADERRFRWEKRTVEKLREMIPAGLAMDLPSRLYFDYPVTEEALYCDGIAKDLHLSNVSFAEHPEVQALVELNTVSINPHTYLPALKAEIEKRGVIFRRHRAASLDEICQMAGEGGVVVNATGLGARSLAGVQDTKVYPIRGQTILVHAPGAKHFIAKYEASPKPEVLYMIPRPAPSGEALVGGTFQPGNWDLSVDWNTAENILENAKKLIPELSTPSVYIKHHNVGLRPGRDGGPRVETEICVWPKKSTLAPGLPQPREKRTLVLHAYGFGGAGYQQSWGAAEEAVDLLKQALTT
ncbi:nucleotide-binding domain-containing protein [Vararia minispora EC-137]|uniref:Nucleotide-binding domain-containing protein n=1 Tax=Vararia minispora EC-137 TaxID=1314806 RepID=A0ACB8QLL5_9AGAM|nr:nucleotide-binding domain-containing protein [Vararia minispora EC-137]